MLLVAPWSCHIWTLRSLTRHSLPWSPELEAGGDHQPVIRHGVPGLGHQLVTRRVKTGHGVLQPLGLARKHILKIEFKEDKNKLWQPSLTCGTALETWPRPPPGSTWADNNGHLPDLHVFTELLIKCAFHSLLFTNNTDFSRSELVNKLVGGAASPSASTNHHQLELVLCRETRALEMVIISLSLIIMYLMFIWLTNEMCRMWWDWSCLVLPLLSKSSSFEFTDVMV